MYSNNLWAASVAVMIISLLWNNRRLCAICGGEIYTIEIICVRSYLEDLFSACYEL